MLRAVGGLKDRQGAAQQGLRFRQAVRFVQQRRQGAEVSGHIWVLRAVGGLIDRQGAAYQGLRFRQAVSSVHVLQQPRQVVEVSSYIGM